MIDRVGDVKIAVRPKRHGADALELPGFNAGRAPALDKIALRIELTDARVLAELRDVEVAGGVAQRVADIAELSGLSARRAADGVKQLAVGRINPHAVIMRIADDDVAL